MVNFKMQSYVLKIIHLSLEDIVNIGYDEYQIDKQKGRDTDVLIKYRFYHRKESQETNHFRINCFLFRYTF